MVADQSFISANGIYGIATGTNYGGLDEDDLLCLVPSLLGNSEVAAKQSRLCFLHGGIVAEERWDTDFGNLPSLDTICPSPVLFWLICTKAENGFDGHVREAMSLKSLKTWSFGKSLRLKHLRGRKTCGDTSQEVNFVFLIDIERICGGTGTE